MIFFNIPNSRTERKKTPKNNRIGIEIGGIKSGIGIENIEIGIKKQNLYIFFLQL